MHAVLMVVVMLVKTRDTLKGDACCVDGVVGVSEDKGHTEGWCMLY